MVKFSGYRAEVIQQHTAERVVIQAEDYHSKHPEFESLLSNEDSFFHVLFPEYLYSDSSLPEGKSSGLMAQTLLKRLQVGQMYRPNNQKSIYLYRTVYRGTSGVALIGGLSCEDYKNRKIIPHEGYIPEKKSAIKRKAKELGYFTSLPMVCNDLPEPLNKFIAEYVFENPLFSVKTSGVLHQLFELSPEETNFVSAQFNQVEKLFITDGHHRFEGYSEVIDELGSAPGLIEDSDLIPVAVYNIGQISVLRFYRLLQNVGGLESTELNHFLELSSEIFEISELTSNQEDDFLNCLIHKESNDPIFSPVSSIQDEKISSLHPTLNEFSTRLEPNDQTEFSIFVSGLKKWFKLKSRKPIEGLHLNFLHNIYLSKFLGNGLPGKINYLSETQGNFLFQMKLADEGRHNNLVVLYYKMKADEVIETTEKKIKFPPKSSLFYPKPLVGMLLRPLFAPCQQTN